MNHKPTEAERRQTVIDGLRELADFLTEHPDVPVSVSSINTITYLPRGTDEDERAEVDRVAAILGVTAGSPGSPDHYEAVRQFGGIAYQAVAITKAHMDRWHAERSYAGSVEPEAVAGAACGQCRAPVQRGEEFCEPCSSRCHEATEFDHECAVCADSEATR